MPKCLRMAYVSAEPPREWWTPWPNNAPHLATLALCCAQCCASICMQRFVVAYVSKALLNKDFRFTAEWRRHQMHSDTQAALSKTVDHIIVNDFDMSALPFAAFTAEHMAQTVFEACASLGVDPSYHPTQTKKRASPDGSDGGEDHFHGEDGGFHGAAPLKLPIAPAGGAVQPPCGSAPASGQQQSAQKKAKGIGAGQPVPPPVPEGHGSDGASATAPSS